MGEWLTRRIIRSFAGDTESFEPMRETYSQQPAYRPEPSSPYRSDSGSAYRPEPSPAARAEAASPYQPDLRGESSEFLARISRGHSETQDIYKRLEGHLSGLGRRLETTERSTAENNRAMNQAAAEINIASREQAKAFEQLSSHVLSLSSRLDRIEQSGNATREHAQAIEQLNSHVISLSNRLEHADQATNAAREHAHAVEQLSAHVASLNNRLEREEQANAGWREQSKTFEQIGTHVVDLSHRVERIELSDSADSTKEAITTLHHGLSRLADQIGETAKQSASQIETLAMNLEAVVAKVTDARVSADGAMRTLEQRLGMLDERVRVVERVSHSSADALDKALENMEARQMARADEMGDIHRRVGSVEHLNDAIDRLTSRFASNEAQTATAIARMEDNILRIDGRGSDPAIDRRLNSIERTLGDIVARFEGAANTDESIHRLVQRVDVVEHQHADMLDQLQAKPSAAPVQPEVALAPQPTFEQAPTLQPAPAFAPATAFAQVEPASPVFDAPPFPEVVAKSEDPFADAFAPVFAAPPPMAEPTAASVFGDFAPQASPFATEPSVDAPSFTPAAPPPVANETFLSAARRSAKAAAAQVETDRTKGFSGFNWGPAQPAAAAAAVSPSPMLVDEPVADEDDETKPNRTRYMLIAAAVLILLLAATSIILSQRAGVTQAEKHTGIGTLFSNSRQPGVGAPQETPSTSAVPTPAPAVQSAPRPQTGTQNDSFSAVPPKPALTTHKADQALATSPSAQVATAPKPATTAVDKLTTLANAGNAKAELVVGLKYIDGDGVSANPVEGAKWIQKAAAQNEPVAAYRLGTLYERGKGVPSDAAKATRWYLAAAQAGNRKAMHNIAVAYAQGAGTGKNFTEAARWFSKAAALGLSDSQFNLAVLYERGLGVPQNLSDAYKWYAIAAAQGDTESKARIDALSTQISPDDRAAAQRSADLFRPQALDRRANVAPDIADIAR